MLLICTMTRLLYRCATLVRESILLQEPSHTNGGRALATRSVSFCTPVLIGKGVCTTTVALALCKRERRPPCRDS
eukprot:2254976-Rhodomonas_salina.1